MAWTEITRRKYRRDGLRYASHLTDAEWALIEPLMPPASPLGRPRETNLRSVMNAILNAILYMASTGCQWRQLPKDFPPYSTVQGYFYDVVAKRPVREHQPRAGDGGAREGGARGQPDRRR